MGILSWFSKGNNGGKKEESPVSKPDQKREAVEVPGMNGAVEVQRPASGVTIFEFGSVAASADNVTMTGYCPVSDDIEPCRWAIMPPSGSNAPRFRVVF